MSKNKKSAEVNNTETINNASSEIVQETGKESKQNVKNEKSQKLQAKAKQQNKKKANVNDNKKTLGQRTRATVSELKKVTWPTFGQTLKQTGVVIGFVLIFVVLLLGLNSFFGWLFNLIVGSL